MPVCPLEFRYGRDAMKQVFDEEKRLGLMLDVEAALARAHAGVGNIDPEHAQTITQKANTGSVTWERVKQIEVETNHDIMAMVKALAEQCGGAGDSVHLGATSNDIVDTVTALQLKQAIDIIEDDLILLENTLAGIAEEHRATMMVGRTHGQFATPLTFGLKLATMAMEAHRHRLRLREVRPRACVGKMRGAVGTGAAMGEKALEVERLVMEELGLGTEEASLQLVGRDRYVEFISLMACISASLEKFATEVRNLQRSEIGEVAEAFDAARQVGSSTMAHKRNPITCENICSLARLIRGFTIPTWDNVPLWHERDLTNSAGERFTISHVCILIDDILVKTNSVFSNLIVFPERMRQNLESTKGVIMAEAVMMALVGKGMGRQDAHELMRRTSLKALDKGTGLRDTIRANESLAKMFTDEELDTVLDPANYLGKATEIVDSVVKIIREDK